MLVSGRIELCYRNKTITKKMVPYIPFKAYIEGSYFGEEEMFCKIRRNFYLRASEDSEVFYITRSVNHLLYNL